MNQPAYIIKVAPKGEATHTIDTLNPRVRGERKWEPQRYLNVNGEVGQAGLQSFAIVNGLASGRDFERSRVRIAPIVSRPRAY